MDIFKSKSVSRRKVLKASAFVSAALALGIFPSRLVEANTIADAPMNPNQIGFMHNQEKCVGCRRCQSACKKTNNWESGTEWRRVNQGTRTKAFLSMSCNHCEKPACASVCPVKAYVKQKDTGIVIHDPEKCVGCKYCMYACPYHAPQFSVETGRISKCHFCHERQAKGENPACVDSCPVDALKFGKLSDLRQTPGGVSQLEGMPSPELTKPSFVIIPKK